ncbi:hypothetical protein D9M71_195430 [compost metagenome]
MRRELGQVDRLAVEEHVMDETQRIGDREDPRQGRPDRNHPVETAEQVVLEGQRLAEEHLLAEEAVEQRHSGHRQRRHHRQRRGMRHVLEHAVDAPHVAAAGLVVDDPRSHEQRCLEGGMVDDVEDRRHRRQRCVEAEQQSDQAEMADGRECQQALEVVLEQRHHRTDQQGRQPGEGDQVEPPLGTRQYRVQARQQEHPDLDHGRRVQVGRHRGRRRHRVRQPEMEGKLRRLGEHAEQDQAERQRVQRVVADEMTGCKHLAQLEAADDAAQ